MERIDRDVGWEVVKLWAGPGIMLSADHYGDRGGIEMEEGVDAVTARGDGDGASGFQELDPL